MFINEGWCQCRLCKITELLLGVVGSRYVQESL